MRSSTKLALSVLALCASLTWYIPAHYSHSSGPGIEDKSDDYGPTENELNGFYREANRLYFYGGLRSITVNLEYLPDSDFMGRTTPRTDGTFSMTINKKFHPTLKQAEMTELHEMCHEEDLINDRDEGIDSHSNAFQACMKRVAVAGGMSPIW